MAGIDAAQYRTHVAATVAEVCLCQTRAGNRGEALRALDRFKSIQGAKDPQDGVVMAVALLKGPQFSVECFGEAGRHVVVGTTRKYSDPVTFTEIGHVSPGMTDDQQRIVGDYVVRVLEALGIVFGSTHTEVVLTNRGPRIIETHLRVVGDEIPHLVADVTGVDLPAATIAQTLGEPVLANGGLAAGQPRARASAIWYLVPDVEGRLCEVTGMDEAARLAGVVEARLEVSPGERVHSLHSSQDRAGWIRCHGKDAEAAVAAAQVAASRIEFLVAVRREPQSATV